MQAQEFSSPGEHMASLASNSNQGYTSNGVIYAGASPASVSFGPPISDYNLFRDSISGNYRKSRRSDDLDDYIGQYLKYNDNMFARSIEYDQYMSNTAIRRQMEDLKAAGINPILAGRLGGASYKGVNAPYVSINPASAFANMYSADSYSDVVNRQINAELERTNLTNENMLQIARENNLNDIEVATLMSGSNTIIESMRDAVNYSGQDKDLIGRVLSAGLGGLSTLAILAMKNNNKGDNNNKSSSNGYKPTNYTSDDFLREYNERKKLDKTLLFESFNNAVSNVVGFVVDDIKKIFQPQNYSTMSDLLIGAGISAGAPAVLPVFGG